MSFKKYLLKIATYNFFHEKQRFYYLPKTH